MKLNLGAGSKRYPGYLNIDIDPQSNPDYTLNLETDFLPFKDNSVDSVLAYHIFEHLGDGFFHAVKELYRVCKHDTIIDVHVPHPRHDIFLIDPTHKRPIYPLTLDMFSKTKNKSDLESNNPETPLGFIHDVDLYVAEYTPVLDQYWAPQFQKISEEQCDHIARSFNNVIVEYHIKWVVNKQNCVTR